MDKQMRETITARQIRVQLENWKKELAELEEKVKSKDNEIEEDSSIKTKSTGLDYLKLTEDMKRRIELRQLIKKYEYFLQKNTYKFVTDAMVEDLKDISNLPEFSWGISEANTSSREVVFEQSRPGQEYIKVTNYGEFKYIYGEGGAKIGDIPSMKDGVICDLKAVTEKGKTTFQLEDVFLKYNQFFGEQLNLLRITKGTGENQMDYLVLSPIKRQNLEDETIRKFFVNEYCSDLYLYSVVTGKNGIYAGNIVKSEEGECSIKYAKSSVRAAKLAEIVFGTTELTWDLGYGDIRRFQDRPESFEKIRGRFYKEIADERDKNAGEKGKE